ncbi:MAG: T9SS type A sorting domain-containing protein [candidate division WOR-3 bacterium]
MNQKLIKGALCLVLLNFASGWTLFERSYGGKAAEEGLFVVPRADSGFFVAGYADSAPGYGRTYVLKVDKHGELVWSKLIVDTLGGVILHGACGDGSGGCVVVGQERSSRGDWDMFIQWIDSSGALVWRKNLGSTDVNDIGAAVCQTEDGGWVVVGNTITSQGWDVTATRLDRTGYVWWSKSYSSAGTDLAYAVTRTYDRGYVIAGATYPTNARFSDILLFKVDYWGYLVWQRSFGDSLWDEARAVIETKDSGIALAGFSSSYGEDIDGYLLCANAYGLMRWVRTFPKVGYEKFYGLAQTQDGGFVLTGESAFPGEEADLMFLRTNPGGEMLWQRFYGGEGDDCGRAVVETGDGFVLTGKTWTDSINRSDVYLIRTNSSGNVGVGTEGRRRTANGLRVYPNPFRKWVCVTLNGEWGRRNGEWGKKVRIFNQEGVLVQNLPLKEGNWVVWNGCDFSNRPVAKGVYMILLPDNQRVKVVKM